MANKRNAGSAPSFAEPLQPMRSPRNEPNDAGPADPAGDSEPLDAAIARVLAELGGDADASINVYAIRPGSRAGEFVDSFPGDAFDGEASFLKRIRDEFGPGEYRIQLRHGTTFRVNRVVRIAPARERPRAEPADMAAVVSSALVEQGRRLEELLRQVLPARAPESDESLLNRLKLMRDVFAPAGGGARGGGAEAITVFLQGLNLGRSLEPHGSAGTSDVLLETVKTLGPELARVVREGQAAQQRLPAKRDRNPPLATAAAPAAPPPAPAAPGQPAMTPEIRKLLDLLLDAAARDADPELYAELVIDQVGVDELTQLAAMGDPVELLAGLEPRVRERLDWFRELHAAMEALLTDEDPNDADGTAAGQGGRDADAEGHARTH